MITLRQYILESKNAKSNWLDCVKKMYKWYCDNFKNFYDTAHHYKNDNYKKCDLLDDKQVMADCSGFVGACLCLAGYSNNPLNWNVRLGSFNHYKNLNTDNISNTDKKYKNDLLYISDINAFKCHKIMDSAKERLDYSEIKAGDILVKGSHVTIAADDGAKHLYDWGRQISAQSEKMLRNYKPINFYIPKDKNNIIYPYRSYWRLK